MSKRADAARHSSDGREKGGDGAQFDRGVFRSAGALQRAASIADAAWMAGRWIGEGLGGTIEEAWSEPDASGQMVGYFALRREGAPVFYEIMLIDEFEGGLRLRVKHFNPDFVGWEEKDGWTLFTFVSAAPGALRWTALTLEAAGESEMIGRIRLRGADNSVREEVLRYRRAPL